MKTSRFFYVQASNRYIVIDSKHREALDWTYVKKTAEEVVRDLEAKPELADEILGK